jgi:hypothetical protein
LGIVEQSEVLVHFLVRKQARTGHPVATLPCGELPYARAWRDGVDQRHTALAVNTERAGGTHVTVKTPTTVFVYAGG